ncbi:MAG: hypothetical protein LW650_03575 [Planctomycetaceae bacterium]|jgi:hypothetical protein|nr:DinB family protein [Phycisphaerales bacterium]MCE2652592.1 hypothetical protein [Planctomycetaceae bacterium]
MVSEQVCRAGVRLAQGRTLAHLQAVHATLLFLLEDVHLRTWRPTAHTTPESPEWVVTHLTAYYAFVTANLGGKPPALPGEYVRAHDSMFGPGGAAVRTPRPSTSPRTERSPAIMLRRMRRGFATMLRAGENLTPSQVLLPPAGAMAEYAPDRLACLERAAWHEGWHTAHLAAIRRARGLPPAF